MRAERLVTIHAQPHPLRAELLRAEAPEGLTLAEMLGAAAGPAIQAWVGDVRIPREAWCRVRPKAGAIVTVRAVAQDGNGNKVLRTVLQVAVLVAASYLPGAAAGAGTLAKIGYAAAVIGGSLAVNALVPPQLPRPDRAATGLQALSGSQNEMSPFGPVPRVYGRMRVYPPFAARPYTEVVGNDQYLRSLLCLGYGPLDISELKIGETLISPSGVTLTQNSVENGVNYDNVQYEISSAPLLFSNDIFEEGMSVELNSDGNQDVRVTQAGTREISIDLTFPIGLIAVENDDGDKHPLSIWFTIEYRAVGSVPWLNVKDADGFQVSTKVKTYIIGNDIYFEDKTRNGRRGSVRWQVDSGQYEVRVTRVDSRWQHPITGWNTGFGGITAARLVTWSALRSVGDVSITPRGDLVYLALRIKATAQLNGLVDTVNCVAQAVVDVWDGVAFTEQPTSNPAWAFIDAACGSATERGLDKETRFWLDEIKAWADECAADGREFNCEVASTYGRTTVFDLMREIAAVGRASFSMRDGKYTVVRDQDGQAPVQVFTPRNSWGFSGEKSFQQVPHALRTRFMNDEAGYKLDERIVYDDGFDATTATRFESLEMRGVTDPVQAWKEARYHLAVARLRSESFAINVDIENLVCQRGDLVRVAHDVIRAGLGWGRLKSVAGAVVTLDDAVTMQAGKIYALRLRKSVSGSIVIKTLITAPGEQTVVTMTSAEAGAAAGDLYVFGESGQESIACKVLTILPSNDLTAQLTLAPEAPSVHAADVGGAPAHQGPTSIDEKAPEAPRVYHTQSDETVLLQASDGSLISQIIVYYGFQASVRPPAVTVEGQYRVTGQESWTSAPTVQSEAGQISMLPVDDGEDYDFRVRAIAADGTPSEWTTVTAYRVIGKTTPPPDIETLYLNGDRLSWDYPTPPVDFDGFLVRYQAGQNTNWENAIAAHTGIVGSPPFDVGALPAGQLTILVKAVDSAGFESANAVTLYRDFGDPIVENILFSRDYDQEGFPGTITNGAVVGSDLQANVAGVFWPTSDADIFWDGPATGLFWEQIYETLTYEIAFTPDAMLDGDGTTLTAFATVSQGASWRLEYRVAGAETFWIEDDTGTFWGADASTFWAEGDGDYRPWPGALTDVPHVTYYFRLTVEGGLVQGIVDRFNITLDVPDIIEHLEDVALATGGSVLPITKTYRAIANLQLTLQNDGGAARTIKIIDKVVTGPTVQAFDSSGVGTTAVIDATIQGY